MSSASRLSQQSLSPSVAPLVVKVPRPTVHQLRQQSPPMSTAAAPVSLESLTRSYREQLLQPQSSPALTPDAADAAEDQDYDDYDESVNAATAEEEAEAAAAAAATAAPRSGIRRRVAAQQRAPPLRQTPPAARLTAVPGWDGADGEKATVSATLFEAPSLRLSGLSRPAGYFLVTPRLGERASLEWRRRALRTSRRVGGCGGSQLWQQPMDPYWPTHSARSNSSATISSSRPATARLSFAAAPESPSSPAASAASSRQRPGSAASGGSNGGFICLTSLVKRFPEDFLRLPTPNFSRGGGGCLVAGGRLGMSHRPPPLSARHRDRPAGGGSGGGVSTYGTSRKQLQSIQTSSRDPPAAAAATATSRPDSATTNGGSTISPPVLAQTTAASSPAKSPKATSSSLSSATGGNNSNSSRSFCFYMDPPDPSSAFVGSSVARLLGSKQQHQQQHQPPLSCRSSTCFRPVTPAAAAAGSGRCSLRRGEFIIHPEWASEEASAQCLRLDGRHLITPLQLETGGVRQQQQHHRRCQSAPPKRDNNNSGGRQLQQQSRLATDEASASSAVGACSSGEGQRTRPLQQGAVNRQRSAVGLNPITWQ